MNFSLRKLTSLCLLLPFVVASVHAQIKFEAIPPELAPKYKFDFARNFFATPDAEKSELAKAFATLGELEKLKGKVTASADNLQRALELSDRAQSEFYGHIMYFYLRSSVNTLDEASSNEASRLGTELGKRSSFLQQELMRLDSRTLNRFFALKPTLKDFAFVIESARRNAPHTLSLKEEELLSELEPAASDWTAELFQRALDRTTFGTVKSADESLDVYQQEQEVQNSTDRRVREEGFKKKFAGFASQRDLYAFSLSRLIRTANKLAELRHFRNSADETHFNMFLTTAEVKELYERIANTAETNKRFQRLRAAQIKKENGYSDVNTWDMTVVAKGFERPRFTIAETTRILNESLTVFGPEYSRELAALLDPANGRLDIVGGTNRVPGAFADGNLGNPPSIFYSFNYEGYFDDVDALAHEAGHAVHFQLMGNNHVRPSYADGPSYFTESFAMFNELVVIDHLLETEKDPARKAYFLEQFLTYGLFLYSNTQTAAIEQAIYDEVEKSDISSADDFDAVTKRVGARYSIWYDKHDELKMRWIAIHHYFDNPMYYPNYVYAQLLALKYFELYKKNPKEFLPKYLALMRNGFNAPPSDLLKKFVAIDLRDPKLVTNAVGILDNKIDELEMLYK